MPRLTRKTMLRKMPTARLSDSIRDQRRKINEIDTEIRSQYTDASTETTELLENLIEKTMKQIELLRHMRELAERRRQKINFPELRQTLRARLKQLVRRHKELELADKATHFSRIISRLRPEQLDAIERRAEESGVNIAKLCSAEEVGLMQDWEIKRMMDWFDAENKMIPRRR